MTRNQNITIGNASSEIQENCLINKGTKERDFTVGTSNDNLVINENAVHVKTSERCFNEKIDREMDNFVDTVENTIQNENLTALIVLLLLRLN